MNQEQMDFLSAMGVDIAPKEDKGELTFEPLKGCYKVRGVSLELKSGTSQEGLEWSNYELQCQVAETLEGDKGTNRYLRKTFWNGVSKYNDDPDAGAKQLINALLTMGIDLDFDASDSDVHVLLAKNLNKVEGHEFFVRTYVKNEKQVVLIIKNPVVKNPFEEKVPDETAVPF